MNLEIRKELLAKMKALYPNDESALLLVISEFLKEQRANTMGFMLRADAKWLNSFGPATLSYPEKFYKNSYDSQYLELLIELVQININESKNTNSLAETIGEHSLDYKDYEKAQKTLDKLKTFIN